MTGNTCMTRITRMTRMMTEGIVSMGTIHIQRSAEAVVRLEGGCAFRRILPWQQPGPSTTGMGTCAVAPGEATVADSHADYEHFYVIRGSGHAVVDGDRVEIGTGDALVVDAHQVHHFENSSSTDELELLSVWSPEPFGQFA